MNHVIMANHMISLITSSTTPQVDTMWTFLSGFTMFIYKCKM